MPTTTKDNTPLRPAQCFGAIVITARAQETLKPADVTQALRRHLRNDWGTLAPEDAELNRQAVEACDGRRVMSVYTSEDGEKFWIMSYLQQDPELMADPDYCNTCIMLPSDY